MTITTRFALTAAIVIAGHIALGAAQEPAAKTPAARTGEIAANDPLFAETSAIRELPIRRPVKSVFASRDEIERFATMKFDEQTTADEVRAAELSLRVLGLVPGDFSYRPFFAALMKEQVAGAYDPSERQMQLPDWVPIGAQSAVLVHELTHALQDQHFDLGRLERWQKGDSDAQLAAHALAEGDAMLAMVGYLTKHPEAAQTLLQSAGALTDSPVLNAAPAALRETLAFPYEYGMRFAAALHGGQSWKAVSAAYDRLPLSSEQVMHPEKYLAYERPVAVPAPDVTARLGSGWRRLQTDTQGEWGYLQILKAFLPQGQRAAKAAEGWGGDRFGIYVGPKPDDVLLMQVSAWDTPADAAEFFQAYVDRSSARYALPAGTPIRVIRADDTARATWSSATASLVVELRGARVLMIEGPAGVDTAGLAADVWR